MVLACVLILALDVWQSWNARVEKQRESIRTSVVQARVAAQQIQDALQITDTVLHEVAQQVTLHGTTPVALAEMAGRLRLDADAIPQITDILVIDPQGKPLAGSFGKEHFRENYSGRDYFAWLAVHRDTGMYISPPVMGHTAKQWLIPVAIRIDNPDGSFGGVVVAGLGIEYQKRFFADMNLGRDGVVNIVRDDGLQLMRWPFNPAALDMARQMPAALFPAFDKETSRVLRSPVDGVRRFYGFRRLAHYPLFVSVGLSTREAFAPWYRDALLHTIAGILMALATSLFGIRLMRQIAMRTHAEQGLSVANRTLQQLALNDSLTGLPNRMRINEELQSMLEAARQEGSQFAVLFIDLDRFKRVNDTRGHAAGDEVLREIAFRLKRCVRRGDLVGRLGGDEFLALLHDCGRRHAADVAERMLQAIYQPILLADEQDAGITLSASIGISLYPRDGQQADALLRDADIAMYRAKSQNRNEAYFFEPEYEREVRENLDLETALRRALRAEALRVVYQPKVDAAGRLQGVEALLRWRDAELGVVEPDRFIAIAEESGLIADLDAWVLGESCRQLAEWRAAGLDLPGMSVNVCAADFRRANYPDFVARVLQTHGLNAADLTLEMTERVMFGESTDDIRAALDRLHQLGVQLSIDDFGTGYSSLSYLYRFPVSELKIDRSFVRDLGVDRTAESLAQAIVNIGNVLRLKVVAEGVETQAQRDFLFSHGCSIYQGYLYSPPLEPMDFALWAAESRTPGEGGQVRPQGSAEPGTGLGSGPGFGPSSDQAA